MQECVFREEKAKHLINNETMPLHYLYGSENMFDNSAGVPEAVTSIRLVGWIQLVHLTNLLQQTLHRPPLKVSVVLH